MTDATRSKREQLRAERAPVARYRGRCETRIILTFLAFTVAWVAVVILGTTGAIPLWLGMVVNTVIASTFYMPVHEAVHGNISGDTGRARWLEKSIGIASTVPLAMTSFEAHRTIHMRHHAYTNDPIRDPDHYVDGSLLELIPKVIVVTAFTIFLPVFAFVPPTRRLLPAPMRASLTVVDDGLKKAGVRQFRFWLIVHGVLLVAVLLGYGWDALLLWYLPARVAGAWLAFIFAWYPHHPASQVGRYVDTRVAVFPGVRWLARGHEFHALHHLFPRVPHYRLPELWSEVGEDMVAKGVRAEGTAPYATGPIVW
jgi:fatty acid desaturase